MHYKSTLSKTFTVIIALFSLTACATIKGMGEDIERAGEAVQEAAES